MARLTLALQWATACCRQLAWMACEPGRGNLTLPRWLVGLALGFVRTGRRNGKRSSQGPADATPTHAPGHVPPRLDFRPRVHVRRVTVDRKVRPLLAGQLRVGGILRHQPSLHSDRRAARRSAPPTAARPQLPNPSRWACRSRRYLHPSVYTLAGRRGQKSFPTGSFPPGT